MAKTKTIPKKTKPHNHSHSNSNKAMDKVKIKRVKRNKKKTTTKEKILAGIGVGSTLLGGASMVNPQSNPTQFVRTQSTEAGNETSKVKDTLKKIFGVSQAKAYTDLDGVTYDENTTPLEEVTEEPVVEEPVVEEPVVEEPTVEEPVVEEVTEEPTVEEPVVEPVVEEPVVEEPVVEEPVVEEPVVEEPVVEEPVVEEPVVEEPVVEEPVVEEPVTEGSAVPIFTGAGSTVSGVVNTINEAKQGTILVNGLPQTLAVTPDGRIFNTNGEDITHLFTESAANQVIQSFATATVGGVGIGAPVDPALYPVDTVDINQNFEVYRNSAGYPTTWLNDRMVIVLPIANAGGHRIVDEQGNPISGLSAADEATLAQRLISNAPPLSSTPPGSTTYTDAQLISQINTLQYSENIPNDQLTRIRNQVATNLPGSVTPGSVLAYMLSLGTEGTAGQTKTGSDGAIYKFENGVWVKQTTTPPVAPPAATTNAGVPLNADGSLKPGWIRMGDLVFYNTTTGVYSDRSGQFQYTTLNQFNDVMRQSFMQGFTYRSDPSLPAGFNPLQYASRETALAVATALGLPASSVSLTTVTGPVAPYPQYVITFPNGVVVNAGLVAQEYLKHTPDVANDMIRAEVARGGGSYVFTGANFGNGTESSVTSSSIPANQGAYYTSPNPVTQTGINPANGLSTTTVTQPGVQLPNNTVTGTVNVGTPITGIETSSGTYVTNVATFDSQGRNTNGVLSYGHTIEIGGVGLSAYSSFALQINGVNYAVTRSVISENKITLVLPTNLPTNIPNGAQVKIMVNSTRTGVQSGALAQTLTFRNTNTTTPTHTNPGTTNGFTTGEIPGQEATGAEIRLSKTTVTLKAGTTTTVNFSVRVQDMVHFGATVTSNNPSVATATVNSGTGVITIRGLASGVATLVVHPTGITGTEYDKFIVVLVTADGVTSVDTTGTGSTGTGSTGTGSTGTGSTGTGSTGTSSSNAELLATIERLNAQITQLQNQVNALNSRIASQGSGTTVINNTDTAQLNSLRNQITDLQNLVNRISSGNSNNSQQFQGLQMPVGYPASGGLQYQAPAEIKGVETSTVTYTVKKGDNLWNIAKKYYGDGKQWRKILKENPTCLSIPGNTKTLKIGAVLTIPK